MKIRAYINAVSVSHIDTVTDLKLQEGQWEEMNDTSKTHMIIEYWDNEGLPEIWWEVED